MLQRLEHRLSKWHCYKCPLSWTQGRFRDIEAKWSAARCTAAFTHKMAEKKKNLSIVMIDTVACRRIGNKIFFFFLTIQSSMKPTPARCYQITHSSSAFRSRPLILCLSFLWSQINSTSNKLIFSFLSLLVWNALGNYCLFWLSLFSFVRAKSINILFGNGEHLGVLFIGLHLSHPELTGVLIITVRCSRCISRT